MRRRTDTAKQPEIRDPAAKQQPLLGPKAGWVLGLGLGLGTLGVAGYALSRALKKHPVRCIYPKDIPVDDREILIFARLSKNNYDAYLSEKYENSIFHLGGEVFTEKYLLNQLTFQAWEDKKKELRILVFHDEESLKQEVNDLLLDEKIIKTPVWVFCENASPVAFDTIKDGATSKWIEKYFSIEQAPAEV